MRFIGRIIWVAIAAIIAGLVAAGVAGLIGLELATRHVVGAGGTDTADMDRWFKAYDRAAAFWQQLTGISLLAPLALVAAGEIMRNRSFLYYLAGGGIALAAAPALKNGGLELFRTGALPATVLQLLAVAGFAAGAVYWLLAGRKA